MLVLTASPFGRRRFSFKTKGCIVAKLLLGKPVADNLVERTRERAERLTAAGSAPALAVVRVGEDESALSYERGLFKRAEACGVQPVRVVLDAHASTADVARALEEVNRNAQMDACLMFRPLPKTCDESAVVNLLAAEKDVDGMTAASAAALYTGRGAGFAPCTAAACVELLDYYQVPLDGANVVVVGRSLVIGKPVAQLLLSRNATVTQCHSHTANLPSIMRAADIVVCATGRARAYGAECFSAGQTVIDVGINFDDDGKMCGDVDFDAVEPIVDAITPVPRGVGSVTTSVLMAHVVEAALAGRVGGDYE